MHTQSSSSNSETSKSIQQVFPEIWRLCKLMKLRPTRDEDDEAPGDGRRSNKQSITYHVRLSPQTHCACQGLSTHHNLMRSWGLLPFTDRPVCLHFFFTSFGKRVEFFPSALCSPPNYTFTLLRQGSIFSTWPYLSIYIALNIYLGDQWGPFQLLIQLKTHGIKDQYQSQYRVSKKHYRWASRSYIIPVECSHLVRMHVKVRESFVYPSYYHLGRYHSKSCWY